MARVVRVSAAVTIILACVAPASAESTHTASGRTCGQYACATGTAHGTIDCDQVAADTVTCSAAAESFGTAGPIEGVLRLPGSASWTHHASCSWFVVGGQDQGCGYAAGNETKPWALNESCCVSFDLPAPFVPVTHTSDEPFCVVMYLSVGSIVEATTHLATGVDVERIEASGAFTDVYDIACASGGEPPV